MVLALVSYINLGLSLVVQTDGAVEKKKVTVWLLIFLRNSIYKSFLQIKLGQKKVLNRNTAHISL